MSEIAVICPTLGRPEKLASLVANIQAATQAPHSIYLVMESSDKESIWAAENLPTIDVIGKFGSCAIAVNAGYRASEEPYFAVVNDDCKLHPGWDVAALGRMSESTHIVGLNDGSGDCKCFTLARRSYIEEHSGVFDRANTVYHEGYVSQCVDTEFAFYAQLRGVWADAPDALCEHVHWRFGKADPNHPNYEKARSTNAEDLERYAERRCEWDPKGLTPMAVPGGVL